MSTRSGGAGQQAGAQRLGSSSLMRGRPQRRGLLCMRESHFLYDAHHSTHASSMSICGLRAAPLRRRDHPSADKISDRGDGHMNIATRTCTARACVKAMSMVMCMLTVFSVCELPSLSCPVLVSYVWKPWLRQRISQGKPLSTKRATTS